MKDALNRPRRIALVVTFALLDDVLIVGLVLVVLWVLGVRMNVWSYLAIGLVVGGFLVVVDYALVPTLRRRVVTGVEGMVGQSAVVTEALAPDGTVRFRGELWQARSDAGEMPAGTPVEIVAVDRLTLEVRRR